MTQAKMPRAPRAEDIVESQAAHRAIKAFVDTFARVLNEQAAISERLLHLRVAELLAGTHHEHESVLVLEGKAIGVRWHIDFSPVLADDVPMDGVTAQTGDA